MSASICHIVCAGPCEQLAIELDEDDLLIAADGGYAHCLDVGLEPHLFIGDLDSLPAGMADKINCAQIIMPCDKDDTDTLAACKEGMCRGYNEFRIHAALGGDAGHEVANMQLLAFLHERGAHGILYGNGQQAHFITAQAPLGDYKAASGTRVSVFAFGAVAKGVNMRGLHWELEDAEISPCEPIGVSNRVEGDSFDISVKQGALLVIVG